MTDEQNKVNPAWQGLLDKLPQEFHSLILPDLKAWDQGVQQKFQEIHSQYDDYKAYEVFVKKNIDPEYIEQAVTLADRLQADPKGLMAQVNEAWNLGYVSPEDAANLAQSSAGSGTEDQDFIDEDSDIFKDPRVKAMKEALDQLQSEFQTDKQREEEEAAQAEFEEYLEQLEQETTAKNLPFNKTFVTALISQGIDGEDAVAQYHQVLAINTLEGGETKQETTTETTNPPPVMGSEGSTGGGTPDGSVNFGSLSKNDLNSTIEQMLAQQAQSGQG